MTQHDEKNFATEILVNRIRDEIIPLFDRLITGEQVYFANPYIAQNEDWQRGMPRHCSSGVDDHERCWQEVGEYRLQASAENQCFPMDCKECPVYRGACPTVVEELGEAFNNMVYLLHRKEETVQNAMNFTRDLAVSLESMDLENHLIREKIHTDTLTGLHNRRYMDDCLVREVERCQNRRHMLSVLMIDIDYFKSYNDLYGHLEGDRMLSRIGKLLKASIRDYEQAFRFGGEEFVILLPDTGTEEATMVAERIRMRFETLVFNVPAHSGNPEGRESRTLSVGVASYQDGLGAVELIELADQALYRAKNDGRNRVMVYEPIPVG